MRYRLILIIILSCLVAVLVIGLGDFYNLPLWPVNILNRTYLLQFQCQLESYDQEMMLRFLEIERGISIDLLTKSGKPIKSGPTLEMKTDTGGLFRIYLPQGRYQVRAELMAYFQGQLYHFATGYPGEYVLVHHDQNEEIKTLVLKKLELNNYAVVIARFERFLFEGNLDAAKALIREISLGADEPTAIDKIAELNRKSALLDQLSTLSQDFFSFPQDHYISQLLKLEEMKGIFKTLLPSVSRTMYRISQEAETVYIQPRIEAIHNTLYYIWSEHMALIDSFLSIRQYTRVYAIWLQLTKNPELYRPTISLDKVELEQRITAFRNGLPELQTKVIDQLQTYVQRGIESYERNEIELAFNDFQKAARIVHDFDTEIEFDPDQTKLIEEYNTDINALQAAQRYAEIGDWDKVLHFYNQVNHDCQWLRVQRDDLSLRQKQKE
ncbi:hypothetical protein JXQ70_20635 [bacterium]|nr:hypothetical protein [bacterium]